MRMLDIGPGNFPIPLFETLDVNPGPNVTHVGRAEKPPFPNNTFDIVHASHVIEHIQWYEVEAALAEWVRILRPGGQLEVWTVNAYALMKELVVLEETGQWAGPNATWRQDLTMGDPYKWAVGRLMNYPKKKTGGEHWMHRALITPRYLIRSLASLGLIAVREMKKEEIRGKDHGWINFGITGIKV